MPLDGDEFSKAFLFCQGISLGDLPGKAVGDADVSGFSRLHYAVQPIHDIFDRRLPVPHVINIEIYIVHTEIVKACVYHVFNMLLPADAAFDLFLCPGKEFRGNDYIIAFCEVAKRPADILFACAALISDSRIVEVDAQIQSALNDLSCMFFIDGPAVLSASGISEAHASHADPGYV